MREGEGGREVEREGDGPVKRQGSLARPSTLGENEPRGEGEREKEREKERGKEGQVQPEFSIWMSCSSCSEKSLQEVARRLISAIWRTSG